VKNSFKLSSRISNLSLKTICLIALAIIGITLALTQPALAFDPKEATTGLLDFVGLILILAVGVAVVVLITKHQVMPAVVLVLAGAFLYAVLNPDVMKSIGEGFATLIGAGS